MPGRNHSRYGRNASWAKLVMGETRGYLLEYKACSCILESLGRRASHPLTEREGIGSSGKDFNVELWISDLTLLADRILNADNDGVDRVKPLAGVDVEAGNSVISASICLWIASIFDTKYFPTSFAKVGACRFGGNSSPCD